MPPMFIKKTYRNVVEMARDIGVAPVYADDLRQHVAERQLVRRLFALRCARGLSQKDVADKMSCTQGRISKLEASRDEDLSLGDIRSYAEALGLTTILGLESGPSAVARVKFHHACVRSEVETLAKLAGTDDRIAAGIARFFDQTAYDFLTMLEDATKKLPAEVQPLGVSVVIVGPDEDGCSAEESGAEVPKPEPPRPKRSRKPKAPCG